MRAAKSSLNPSGASSHAIPARELCEIGEKLADQYNNQGPVHDLRSP